MKIIKVKHFIPGYKAMCLGPIILVKQDSKFDEKDLNHEKIHWEQEKECLILPFLLWYGVEFLIKLAKYKNWHKAYRAISFERESYANQNNSDYIENRSHFSWFKYIKQ